MQIDSEILYGELNWKIFFAPRLAEEIAGFMALNGRLNASNLTWVVKLRWTSTCRSRFDGFWFLCSPAQSSRWLDFQVFFFLSSTNCHRALTLCALCMIVPYRVSFDVRVLWNRMARRNFFRFPSPSVAEKSLLEYCLSCPWKRGCCKS